MVVIVETVWVYPAGFCSYKMSKCSLSGRMKGGVGKSLTMMLLFWPAKRRQKPHPGMNYTPTARRCEHCTEELGEVIEMQTAQESTRKSSALYETGQRR
jgi:hypothetical protein